MPSSMSALFVFVVAFAGAAFGSALGVWVAYTRVRDDVLLHLDERVIQPRRTGL